MTGASALLSAVPTGGGGGLTATIGAGGVKASATSSFTFPTNTCVAAGGTGPYAYAWTFTKPPGPGGGSWNTSAVATIDPAVSGVHSGGGIAQASYVCTVTDSAMPPNVAVSNVAQYTYINTSGGQP